MRVLLQWLRGLDQPCVLLGGFCALALLARVAAALQPVAPLLGCAVGCLGLLAPVLGTARFVQLERHWRRCLREEEELWGRVSVAWKSDRRVLIMKRLTMLSCALLVLGACDSAELKSEQPRRDTEVNVLASGGGLTAFSWVDRDTGCQYVTTTYFQNTAQTIPRGGTACPNAALTGR